MEDEIRGAPQAEPKICSYTSGYFDDKGDGLGHFEEGPSKNCHAGSNVVVIVSSSKDLKVEQQSLANAIARACDLRSNVVLLGFEDSTNRTARAVCAYNAWPGSH